MFALALPCAVYQLLQCMCGLVQNAVFHPASRSASTIVRGLRLRLHMVTWGGYRTSCCGMIQHDVLHLFMGHRALHLFHNLPYSSFVTLVERTLVSIISPVVVRVSMSGAGSAAVIGVHCGVHAALTDCLLDDVTQRRSAKRDGGCVCCSKQPAFESDGMKFFEVKQHAM